VLTEAPGLINWTPVSLTVSPLKGVNVSTNFVIREASFAPKSCQNCAGGDADWQTLPPVQFTNIHD
jgi:hypothetical protein